MTFTKRKFSQLSLMQKHKQCAQSLRLVYEGLDTNLKIYNQYLEWMGLASFSSLDPKDLSNQYHWHLSQAQLHLKEHNLLPHVRTGDSPPKKGFSKDVAIYLDQLRSAYNVGSILRTIEALRLGEVYFSKDTPFADHPKVKKIAMGAASLVPCIQGKKLSELPRPLIVLETSNDAISIHDFVFPKSFTLVVGNEEFGVSDPILAQADAMVEIPLVGVKNSLNVACALSSVATEIQRQKKNHETKAPCPM